MKPFLRLLAAIALGSATAFGQPAPAASAPPALTKFDLDFAGGTPGQLVSAIQSAMGRPLNAVIPSDGSNLELPPLKMRSVDTVHLFDALTSVGHAPRRFYSRSAGGFLSYSWGFHTDDHSPTDASIWYFTVSGDYPSPDLRLCRFFLLTPYLERGLTVDDITTAVETAWKMQGLSEKPALSFHKETNLLITVGEPQDLGVVENTLKALDSAKSKSLSNPASAGNKAP